MGDRTLLQEKIRKVLEEENLWNPSLDSELPKKWEKHGNGVIFGPSTFVSSTWETPTLKDKLFSTICEVLNVEKIARRTGSITPNDAYRRPQVELLYGYDGWVLKTENGIRYTWDLTKCMFSSGNISEKQRISSWDLHDCTVVDLYAGIGYFTLSYLLHAKCQRFYACEWNPDALEALKKNLKLNKVGEDRCVVLFGDNRVTCPKEVADHVNLGLIPSSEPSWEVACAALKKTVGGTLHVHGNVDLKGNENGAAKEWDSEYPLAWNLWTTKVVSRMREILKNLYQEEWNVELVEVVKVKSYGPCVEHLVADIKCTPIKKNHD